MAYGKHINIDIFGTGRAKDSKRIPIMRKKLCLPSVQYLIINILATIKIKSKASFAESNNYT